MPAHSLVFRHINKRLMKPCRVPPPLQILVLASKCEKLVVSGTRREITKQHCWEAQKVVTCDSKLRIFYITERELGAENLRELAESWRNGLISSQGDQGNWSSDLQKKENFWENWWISEVARVKPRTENHLQFFPRTVQYVTLSIELLVKNVQHKFRFSQNLPLARQTRDLSPF